MRSVLLFACLFPLTLGACVAQTALAVVEAPVKIASKGVDLATTSQSEADQKRGRELRKREEELGKLQRQYERQSRDCVKGNQGACDQARTTYDRMEAVMPTVPVDPKR